MKIEFICTMDYPGQGHTVIRMETDAEDLDGVISDFSDFLRGAGFCFHENETIGIVTTN